ncbi:MAG: hypothetical protein ACREQ4_16795 [Candidatus Binataceae bacterium]
MIDTSKAGFAWDPRQPHAAPPWRRLSEAIEALHQAVMAASKEQSRQLEMLAREIVLHRAAVMESVELQKKLNAAVERQIEAVDAHRAKVEESMRLNKGDGLP